MRTLVKICGIKTAEALEAAVAGGAGMIGLVFFPPSPRYVTPDEAARLAGLARRRVRVVALVVDADDALLAEIAEKVAPDLFQLHGAESVARCRDIRERFGIPVMKAIKVETTADAEAALVYAPHVERILFDAKAPKGLKGALPGGNGLTFDWRALDGVRGKIDFMLSGGLTPETVGTAIRLTGSEAVDVSSGVESRPGEKDLRLIGKFLAVAQAA